MLRKFRSSLFPTVFLHLRNNISDGLPGRYKLLVEVVIGGVVIEHYDDGSSILKKPSGIVVSSHRIILSQCFAGRWTQPSFAR